MIFFGQNSAFSVRNRAIVCGEEIIFYVEKVVIIGKRGFGKNLINC